MDERMINSYGVPYDYGSIMHYPPMAFARRSGLATIIPRGKRDVDFGQRERLSDYDIQQARAMYGCNVTDFIATPPAATTVVKSTTTAEPTLPDTTPATTLSTTELPTTTNPLKLITTPEGTV